MSALARGVVVIAGASLAASLSCGNGATTSASTADIADVQQEPLLQPRNPTHSLGAAVVIHDLAEPLQRIEAQIAGAAAKVPSDRILPLVRSLLDEPWALPEVAAALVQSTQHPRAGLAVASFAAMALGADAPAPEGTGRQPIDRGWAGIQALQYFLGAGDLRVQEALEPILRAASQEYGVPMPTADEVNAMTEEEVMQFREAWEALRRRFAHDALRFLSVIEQTPMPQGEDLELAKRMAAFATLMDRSRIASSVALADLEFDFSIDWSKEKPGELPEELSGAVEGEILKVLKFEPFGWLVVGGTGSNTYDMSRIAGVFDPGGDDRYEWHDTVVGSRVIIDLEGNDTYVSTGPVGPAGAVLGFSLIRDLKGNDRYEGLTLSSGAALFGAGVLIDDEGDDVHIAHAFSQGAACFGVGILLDHAGSDRYHGVVLCQGVGGPMAAGALIDRSGHDLYSVSGAPSAYGTPATFRAFSQGVGYGVRRDLPGGIGVLVDDSGDDRYQAGEFAQGGGYFFALGILADRAGRDLYHGDRYAQGFAAHQAFGILLDFAGDDVYWSRTAAGQGAAWDESVAMLIDFDGNDTYRADGLSQGAAAQNAIAALVDLGGQDVFHAVGRDVQGAGGSADYHFAQCQCFNLGVLLKRGGSARYSSMKPTGTVTLTAEVKPDEPRASYAYGVLIDESTNAPDAAGR
ncbi:MAG: hypothetical protein KF724_01875 [Phycisphaeraceae bacterium]|nr:hypothetical protein [Phycisphaeraceae bacterium]